MGWLLLFVLSVSVHLIMDTMGPPEDARNDIGYGRARPALHWLHFRAFFGSEGAIFPQHILIIIMSGTSSEVGGSEPNGTPPSKRIKLTKVNRGMPMVWYMSEESDVSDIGEGPSPFSGLLYPEVKFLIEAKPLQLMKKAHVSSTGVIDKWKEVDHQKFDSFRVAIRSACPITHDLIPFRGTCPLEVEMAIFVKRPQFHFHHFKRCPTHLMMDKRDNPTCVPENYPCNYANFVLKAMTGVVYSSHRQINSYRVTVQYDSDGECLGRVHVRVLELDPEFFRTLAKKRSKKQAGAPATGVAV